MCSIYEYFASGRCSELVGHEGAYNIYENELRLGKVYDKLEVVISRIDEIKANQYMLYDAVQEGNRTAEKILNMAVEQSRRLENIERNTELSAHYARIAADNSEACKWIGIANYAELRKTRETLNS